MIQINNGMLIFGGDDEVVIQEATAILSTIIKKYELTEEEIEEMVDTATSYDFEIHEHANDTLEDKDFIKDVEDFMDGEDCDSCDISDICEIYKTFQEIQKKKKKKGPEDPLDKFFGDILGDK